MRKSFDKLYTAYAENAEAPFDGVLELLAQDLGVQVSSLHALGVGFAPMMAFKQGRTLVPGWWVIPERDAEAGITGLSLRAFDGTRKVMCPGSKHGLVYPIKPGYAASTPNYTPGRHNWVRTMDAKLPCPVCGKPDGCLLSAENPADPRAVMCIREQGGAIRPGDIDKGGWLHIRKPAGELQNLSPLPSSQLPVVIVEGMSDTAAALDLGFYAVGRPSDLAGLGHLRQLVAGRDVIIIGENDQKEDGRWPGRTGAERTFETLQHVCNAVWFMPPEGVKDLRSWKNNHGLDQTSLLAYAEQYGSSRSDARHLEDDSPMSVAKRWLLEEHTQEGVPILRQYGHGWYRYNGEHYAEVDKTACVRGGIYRWLESRMVKVPKKDGSVDLVPYRADMSAVSNIIDALSTDCPLQAEPPCWLDGRAGPDPSSLVAFPNGVLSLQGDDPELIPHTAQYFTLSSMPYSYDETADCPIWKKTLSELFPGRPETILLLQEWFGYNLTADTSHQKMMIMNGTSGSGKSTVLEGLRAMLGDERQVATASLTGLSKEYGITPLVGKLAVIVGDGAIDRGVNSQVLLERLKDLTGSVRPMLEVRAMRTDPKGMHIYARVTIACNELPDFKDGGGALPRRVLAIPFTEKFDGGTRTPDIHLPNKIRAEAAGIFNWALEGRHRLRRNGEFTVPTTSRELADTFSRASSPVAQFLDSCCDVGEAHATAEETLFAVFRAWARENSLSAGAKIRFAHNITLAVPSAKRTAVVVNGVQVAGIKGVSLTKYAKDTYLGD